MDFTFNSEQTQLADATRRLLENDYGFDARNRMIASGGDGIWGGLVELGLTALPMPEAVDGFGGGAVDLLPVMQEFGRAMVVAPFFATLVAAEFIKRSGNAAQIAKLGGVADGSVKMAPALGEEASRHDLFSIALRADADGSGWRLSGRKTVVPFGAQADMLVVSAKTADGEVALFAVDATTAGITRHDQRTLDGQRVAAISFDGVFVAADALLAKGSGARELLDAVGDYATALLCAEAVGAMEALNATTLEYAKTRKQFGQPIARFQVLQHRMVDMFIHLEQARSMAYLAAVRYDTAEAGERSRVASAAKVRIGQAARYIGQQAVQIHGGMGVTNELPAAHLFKRLTMIEFTFGDTDHHLQRFIASGATGAAQGDRDVDAERTPARLQRVA